MTGAVRQPRQAAVGAEGMFGKYLAGGIVEAGAGGADPGGVEDGLLCLAFDPPGAFKGTVASLQHVGPGDIGMITVDPAAGVDEDDVVAAEDLIAVGAMRQRGRGAKRHDAECRAGIRGRPGDAGDR